MDPSLAEYGVPQLRPDHHRSLRRDTPYPAGDLIKVIL
jgi:hypothetical protein